MSVSICKESTYNWTASLPSQEPLQYVSHSSIAPFSACDIKKLKEVFRHTLEHTKTQTAILCKMLLIHTTSRFVFKRFNIFLQKLFCDNSFNGSHWTRNLKYLHTLLVLPCRPSRTFVAPQGIIPWNDAPSHPINAHMKPRRGGYQITRHDRGKMDNTQRWLFQCLMPTATQATTDCLIRHLFRKAGKSRQHKPKT